MRYRSILCALLWSFALPLRAEDSSIDIHFQNKTGQAIKAIYAWGIYSESPETGSKMNVCKRLEPGVERLHFDTTTTAPERWVERGGISITMQATQMDSFNPNSATRYIWDFGNPNDFDVSLDLDWGAANDFRRGRMIITLLPLEVRLDTPM